MPINLNGYTVSQVRISPVNATTTPPPIIEASSYNGNEEVEYIIEAENNGKIGSTTFGYKKNDIQWNNTDQRWFTTGAMSGTNIPVTSNSPMENNINIQWQATRLATDNDITYSTPVVGQTLQNAENKQIAMINPPILNRVSNLTLYSNGVTLSNNVDYVLNTTDGYILFTKKITGEVLTSSATNGTKYLTTAVKGIIPSLFVLRENSVTKTVDTDYLIDESGTVQFIQIIPSENILAGLPMLNPLNVVYPIALDLTKNGILLSQGQYSIQTEAGWVGTDPLYVGDVLLASYEGANGSHTNERLIPTAARLIANNPAPYVFSTVSSLDFKLEGDTFNVYIAAGTYNATQMSTLINTVVGKTVSEPTNSSIDIESTETDPNISKIEILTSNTILGFSAGTTIGGYAKGGEYSFTLQDPPVTLDIVTYTAGSTSLNIAGDDYTSELPANRIMNMDTDYYVVVSSSYSSGNNTTTVNLAKPLLKDYNNPLFNYLTGPLTLNLETHTKRNIASGANKIYFDGVDLTSVYTANKLIYLDINDKDIAPIGDYYQCVGSNFKDNTTIVEINANFILSYDAATFLYVSTVPMVIPGGNELYLIYPPVLDKTYSITKNAVVLPTDQYTLDQNGVVKLKDPFASTDVFIASYTGRRDLALGAYVDCDYVYANPLEPKTKITADYIFNNPDVFYLKTMAIQTYHDTWIQKIKKDLKQASNPGVSGTDSFSAPPSGNDTKGVESPKYTQWELGLQNEVAKRYTDYLLDRATTMQNEIRVLDGTAFGATSGYVTEADITAGGQDGNSRFYPTQDWDNPGKQYAKTVPFKINYLKNLALNDDGSSVGAVDPNNLTTQFGNEQLFLNDMKNAIDLMLAIPTKATSTSGHYDAFYFIAPVNNQLTWTRDGTSHVLNIVATSGYYGTTGFSSGFVISGLDLALQINAVDSGAVTATNPKLQISYTHDYVMGGAAQPITGFKTYSDRHASTGYAVFQSVLSNMNTTLLVEKNLWDAEVYYTGQIALEDIEPATTEALARQPIAQAESNNTAYWQNYYATFDPDHQADLSNWNTVTKPARLAQITNAMSLFPARRAELMNDLSSEALLDQLYGWINIRINRNTGCLSKLNKAIKQESDGAENVSITGSIVDNM